MDKITINGLDAISSLSILEKQSRKFQKLVMNDLETVLDKTDPNFPLIRKIIFDYFSEFTRSVERLFLSDDVEK